MPFHESQVPLCWQSLVLLVGAHVQGAVVLAGEGAGAVWAAEGPLARVGARVLDHGGAQGEGHGAQAALEGLLARVRAHVVHQVALPAEAPPAEGALVRRPVRPAPHPVPAHGGPAARPVVGLLLCFLLGCRPHAVRSLLRGGWNPQQPPENVAPSGPFRAGGLLPRQEAGPRGGSFGQQRLRHLEAPGHGRRLLLGCWPRTLCAAGGVRAQVQAQAVLPGEALGAVGAAEGLLARVRALVRHQVAAEPKALGAELALQPALDGGGWGRRQERSFFVSADQCKPIPTPLSLVCKNFIDSPFPLTSLNTKSEYICPFFLCLKLLPRVSPDSRRNSLLHSKATGAAEFDTNLH